MATKGMWPCDAYRSQGIRPLSSYAHTDKLTDTHGSTSCIAPYVATCSGTELHVTWPSGSRSIQLLVSDHVLTSERATEHDRLWPLTHPHQPGPLWPALTQLTQATHTQRHTKHQSGSHMPSLITVHNFYNASFKYLSVIPALSSVTEMYSKDE